MGMVEVVEPNTCFRGCCRSSSIPLHLPPSSYTLLSPIARGAESVVYEGILDGRRVAVKKPVLSISEDIDKFHKELQLLCKMDHPGMAKLVAAHARPPNYMFFFDFYESGNLAGKLHVEEWSPGVDQVLMIALRLAKALQYLHDNGIIHRDVKPANILLDEKLCSYLSDFGLAEYRKDLLGVSAENWKSSGKPTGGFHKKNMVGTLIYMAPEILRKEIHSDKSDVYSFGITLNELLTGVVPYTDLRAAAQAHTVLEMNYTEQQLTAAVVSGKLRPALASTETGAPSSILQLIQRCWDDDAQNRPTFSDIVLELDLVLESRRKLVEENQLSERYADSQLVIDNVTTSRTFKERINWSAEGEYLSSMASVDGNANLRSWLGSSDFSGNLPIISCGSFSTRGRRETMEDTHFLMPNMSGESKVHAFGVFDGHRGAAAAEFSAKALPRFLQNISSTSSPSDALREAFICTDVGFRNHLESHKKFKGVVQKNWHPGCTAAVSLIVGNKLFVANAGDCRTILCRSGLPRALSKDHVASSLEERERVTTAGGQVKWQVDTWRVGDVALQVTRSIGDGDLKPAVTAEPEITETAISEEDEFLVMASDGLWDVIGNAEVVSLIKDTVKEPSMCAKRLATEAAERGSEDNITVIVVFLRPVSTAERIY